MKAVARNILCMIAISLAGPFGAALAQPCPQHQEFTITADDLDAKLNLDAFAQRHGSRALNLELLALLGIDTQSPVLHDPSDKLHGFADCERLRLVCPHMAITIDMRSGLVGSLLLRDTQEMRMDSVASIGEAEALAQTWRIAAILNPNISGQYFGIHRDPFGNLTTSFLTDEKIDYHGSRHQGRISFRGRVVWIFMAPSAGSLPECRPKISQEEAKKTAIDFAAKRGMHRPSAETVFGPILSGKERAGKPPVHVCASSPGTRRFAWSVPCRPQMRWGIDSVAGFTKKTLGLPLWLGDDKTCEVLVDTETGGVLGCIPGHPLP